MIRAAAAAAHGSECMGSVSELVSPDGEPVVKVATFDCGTSVGIQVYCAATDRWVGLYMPLDYAELLASKIVDTLARARLP